MASDLHALVAQAARENGLDPAFVARLVLAESNWNPSAVSPKGATGLMQLMPATAADYGATNLADPQENIRAGVAHLKRLSDKYQGDQVKIAAAYNAGEGRVDKAGGVPHIAETEKYVGKVATPEGFTPIPDGFTPEGFTPIPDDKKPEAPSMWSKFKEGAGQAYEGAMAPVRAVGDALVGAGKGALGTAADISDVGVNALQHVPGLDFSNARQGAAYARKIAQPTSTAQSVGKVLEQGAEYAVPIGGAEKMIGKATANAPRFARLAGRMVAGAGGAASVAELHGEDPKVAAALGVAGPVVGGAVSAIGNKIGEAAIPLVKAAVKPTVTALRQTAGASIEGLSAKENQLIKFILDNRLTTADKAQAIVSDMEGRVQGLVGNQATDAPDRAMRYLDALRRSAAKQGLAEDEVNAITAKMDELVRGNHGMDVVKQSTVTKPSSILDESGKPYSTNETVETTERQLRPDMPAREALDSARATGRWSTRRQYGELKGAETEASKAVERADRDAMKAAVPGVAPLLKREGQAITARNVLDRMQVRQSGRDVMTLPGTIATATEIAAGKPPIIGFAAQWLRNNQMKAGIYADSLSKAIANNDARMVGNILLRLGVGVGAQATEREQ